MPIIIILTLLVQAFFGSVPTSTIEISWYIMPAPKELMCHNSDLTHFNHNAFADAKQTNSKDCSRTLQKEHFLQSSCSVSIHKYDRVDFAAPDSA